MQSDAIVDVVETYGPTALLIDVEVTQCGLLRSCDLNGIGQSIIDMHSHIVGADKIDDLFAYHADKAFSVKKRLGKSLCRAR